jgi:hypothetical protein
VKKIIFPLGIFAVAIYLLAIIVAGFFTSGYSQVWDTVSVLSAKGEPAHLVLTIIFALTYLSLLVIAIYSIIISRIKIAKVAGIFLSAGAILSIVQLFFPMDQWMGFRTAADKVHDWFTAAIALFIIASIFLFAKATKGIFQKISFWAGGFIAAFSILSGIFLLLSVSNLTGLFERLWIITFLIWIIIFSYNLSRKESLWI